MSTLDWALFATYFAGIVLLGAWAARRSAGSSAGFFVAGRTMPWWTIGLSVMATQASAITLIGTTGKGFADGLRFVQFYFGLPLAMAILAFTLVPLFHRARVYTAYEWLGRRFDGKTRLLTSVLFLLSRGLALGVVIHAPSVVLSLLLGWSLPATTLAMAVFAIAYTMMGGLRAVMWTDVVQMLLIVAGLGGALFVMAGRLPEAAPLGDALVLARETGHLDALRWSLDPGDRYTVWSGLLGGTFLFLAYFGCDQSQVQRFLSGRSLRDSRLALLFNAVLKIPFQLGVLFTGVVLFLVFHFEQPPLLFDPLMGGRLAAEEPAAWKALTDEYGRAHAARAEAALAAVGARGAPGDAAAAAGAPAADALAAYLAANAAVDDVRDRAVALADRHAEEAFDDTNRVFPWFVLNGLPAGLVGLLVAAIFAAAMSSIDSELNALATSSVVDVWSRLSGRGPGERSQGARDGQPSSGRDDGRTLAVSRAFTLGWGVLASLFALWAGALGSVIEAVNIVGSYFYGSLLGVFVLALAVPRSNGHGAFWGLIAGMGATFVASQSGLAWLWLNPVGCLAVVATGTAVSTGTRGAGPAPAR